jgi:hypothetical protein
VNNASRFFVVGASSMVALSATAANLVVNPDFDRGLTGWATETFGEGTAALDDSTGLPSAPSMHLVASQVSSDVTAASSCMPAGGGFYYVYDLYTNIKSNAGFVIAGVYSYSDTDCNDLQGRVISDSIPATGAWDTYSMTDIELPDSTQSARVVLTVTTGSSFAAADANFDHIEFGARGTLFPFVHINQEGLSGTWYNPATSGQGMQIQFSPDDSTPGQGSLFGAWYTFDLTAGDTSSQRWYSFQSGITGDERSASVTIFQNIGGNFDAPPMTFAVAVGAGTLSFDTCTSGSFTYTFTDGRSGTIPLQRLLANVGCVESGTPTNSTSDFGLSGTWYNAATSGQGMLIEINPAASEAFMGWYSYAAAGESSGAAGQRWFSAQSTYTAGSNTADLTIYESTGGIFNSSGGVVTTNAVGTATLTFTSCDDATFDYSFTAGELNGRTAMIPLTRLGETPVSCPFPFDYSLTSGELMAGPIRFR